MDAPSCEIAQLPGLWRRSSITRADSTCDTSTQVYWLQGIRAFIDLRQPMPVPGFAHVSALSDLSIEDCAWLAQQEAFAGHLQVDGVFFEWHRWIDYQPKAAQADAGSLIWEGEMLIETGRDIAYVEHWHRDPDTAASPVVEVAMRETDGDTMACLVRVGSVFMYARERAVATIANTHLSECVARAPSLADAQALVDCEISMGWRTNAGLKITASTLPFRIGDDFNASIRGGSVTTLERACGGGLRTRHWDIVDADPEIRNLRHE